MLISYYSKHASIVFEFFILANRRQMYEARANGTLKMKKLTVKEFERRIHLRYVLRTFEDQAFIKVTYIIEYRNYYHLRSLI